MTGRALLLGVIRAHRGRLALASGLLGAHQAFEALVPVVVGAAIDDAVAPHDGDAMLMWVGVLAVLFLFLSTAYREGARCEERATETAAHELRMQLVDRVVDPRGGGEGGRLPGQLLSVATADVHAAANVIGGLAYGTGVVVALIAGAVVLLLTSLTLGIVVLLGLPVVVWAGGRLGALLSRRAAGQQAEAADASGVATDLVTGLRVLQGIGGSAAGSERYRVASRASLRATLAAARVEATLTSAAVFVGGIALAGVALVGGRLAASGEISLGELIAAAGVTQFMVGPLTRLAWMGALLARARASAIRLAEALAAPPAVAAPVQPHAVEFDGPVALSVESAGLEVPAGALFGLVADDPTGLLAVLGREAEPAGGRVLVGGTDLASIDPALARATVVVAPHDAALLSGTVRDNVLGEPGAVVRALAAAAVDDVVAALPDGLDTVLSDSGSSLSGGQRQRIALARALAAPAPVLVLHEPTTALDAATEARIATALRAARNGATTILATTSPMLLAACDTVAVIRDGAVAREATHAELLASDSGYRETVL